MALLYCTLCNVSCEVQWFVVVGNVSIDNAPINQQGADVKTKGSCFNTEGSGVNTEIFDIMV